MPRPSNGLYAPQSYIKASKEEVDSKTNGCGSAEATFDFVPDTIYGLPICECCNIHDWMYMEGKTKRDKEVADNVFLDNLYKLIEDKTSFFILRWLRKRRALKYYGAVKLFGSSAFWKGKKRNAQ